MVGAPMAIMLRRADFLQIFIICFLPILVVYYPLLAYGVDGAKAGDLPSYAVWLGNVVLAVWSYWAVRRILRY
jgi:lipopolysaccharide export system permease protein